MVNATLLGLEPSTIASQWDQCPSAFRLASLLLSIDLSFFRLPHFSLNAFNLLSFPDLFIFLAPLCLFFIYLSPSTTVPWPLFICPILVFPSPSDARFFLSFTYIHSFMDPSFVFSPHTQIFHSLLPSLYTMSSSHCVLWNSLMFPPFHGNSPFPFIFQLIDSCQN